MANPTSGRRRGLAFGFGAVFAGVAVIVFAASESVSTAAGRSTTAPGCETLALVSARTGAIVRRFPGFAYTPRFASGRVFPNALDDGHGGWFAIQYTFRGRASHARLAHIRNDGTFDRSWPIRLSSFGGYALSRSGGRLYVGSALGVQAYDSASGMRLWISPKITVRGNSDARRFPVVALAATRSTVYVGGDFSRVGGEPRALVAALDARSGHVLPWRMPALAKPDTDASLYTLAVSGTRLYVGGPFSEVGGKPRPGIAAVNAKTGALSPWSPRFQSWDGATSIAIAGDTVLVGGTFSKRGAFDALTGKRRDWAAAMNDATTVTASGSTVFIGGDLRSTLPDTRNNLAAINLNTGVRTGWGPRLERFVTVNTLAVSGGKVLVGGYFCNSVG